MKKYEYLYNSLVAKINEGEYEVGTPLPSENQLINIYHYSRITIRKALDLLEQNGYITKSQGKTSLVANTNSKQKTVLFIVSNIQNGIYPQLLDYTDKYLKAKDINLLITNSRGLHTLEKKQITDFLYKVDAIIIEPSQANFYQSSEDDNFIYENLKRIPTISLNTLFTNYDIASFTINNREVMRHITQQIVNMNREKILIVPKIDDSQGYLRLKGIEDILKMYNQIEYFTLPYTSEEYENIMSNIEKKVNIFKPDCIMFYDDSLAQEFISTTHIDIRHLVLTGFNNTINNRELSITYLSSIYPVQSIAFDLAESIDKMLNGISVTSAVYEAKVIIYN